MVNSKLLIGILWILLTSVSNCSNNTLPKQDISEFMECVGLRNGDKIQKVYELYGKPSLDAETDSSMEFNQIWYEFSSKPIMQITFDKKTSLIISLAINKKLIGGAMFPVDFVNGFFKSKNIQDKKIGLLGVDIEKVLKIYGSKYSHMFNSYEYLSPDSRATVQFASYPNEGNTCQSITVFWHPN